MAGIIGGVAASHTPTIGFAYDQHKQDDPSWAPIFKLGQGLRDRRLAQVQPCRGAGKRPLLGDDHEARKVPEPDPR